MNIHDELIKLNHSHLYLILITLIIAAILRFFAVSKWPGRLAAVLLCCVIYKIQPEFFSTLRAISGKDVVLVIFSRRHSTLIERSPISKQKVITVVTLVNGLKVVAILVQP